MHRPTTTAQPDQAKASVQIDASPDLQKCQKLAATADLGKASKLYPPSWSISLLEPNKAAAVGPGQSVSALEAAPAQSPLKFDQSLIRPGWRQADAQMMFMGVGSLALAAAAGLWLTHEAHRQQVASIPQLLPTSELQTATKETDLQVSPSSPSALTTIPTAPQWSTVPRRSKVLPTISHNQIEIAATLERIMERQANSLAVASTRSNANTPASITHTLTPPLPIKGIAENTTASHSSSVEATINQASNGARELSPITPIATASLAHQSTESPSIPVAVATAPLQSSTQVATATMSSVVLSHTPTPTMAFAVTPSFTPAVIAPEPTQLKSQDQSSASISNPQMEGTQEQISPLGSAIAPPAQGESVMSPNTVAQLPTEPDTAQPTQLQKAEKGTQATPPQGLTLEEKQFLASATRVGPLSVIRVDWATYQKAWVASQSTSAPMSPSPPYGYVDYSRALIMIPTE